MSGGLWNTVANGDYPAMTTLWFAVSGVAFVGLAALTRCSWLDTGRIPRETGWTLLTIELPTAVLEPTSGGWLVLAIGVLALRGSTPRASSTTRANAAARPTDSEG